MVWERVAAAVTGPRSWLLAAVAVLAGVGVMALVGPNTAAGQAPQSLPQHSPSARITALAGQFPGGDRTPLIVVVSRADGAVLGPADLGAARAARDRAQAAAQPGAAPAQPLTPSQDGKAALGVVPLSTTLSGLALNDAVSALRTAAATGLAADLQVHVTGGPAFGADIAGAFTHANVTLLAVTASVVALLLIATYRSPVLWLVPLLVVAFADRVAAAVGTAVASLTGLSFDGATSGITSVLVFGAGTNYALLLISRYRQELRRHAGHRDALRRAVHRAGPAIVASNATVVLALLTLLLAATPSTRSLGALAACGLVIAAVSVLVVLPPLLAVCGRRLFWPFIPVDRPATESGRSASGLTQWSVVIDAPPSSVRAFDIVAALRDSTRAADSGALVGGADAAALDVRDAATHDRVLLIPAILAVILIVLAVLLRSVMAPPVLLVATMLGALGALGLGGWVSLHLFGFPALDYTTPLFAFLFLAALGVDYTIFLVTRAREEAARHGTRQGMVEAVAATGGVITSAGIVLAAVFCVLAVLPLMVLTQLGIIVGLGILLDTFVVRTLVIPALFTLVGDRIWWPNNPSRHERSTP